MPMVELGGFALPTAPQRAPPPSFSDWLRLLEQIARRRSRGRGRDRRVSRAARAALIRRVARTRRAQIRQARKHGACGRASCATLGDVDVVLINASVFSLPASQRAGAIVYDGTLDLGLWRPPGPDRDLLHAYGDTLVSVLSKERALLTGGRLAPGQAVRLHPGKLRCDYLIWVASRPPHGHTEPSPAPAPDALEQVALSALSLATKHDTSRVAFGIIGAGRDQGDAADRMAAAVRGAHVFRAKCLQEGISTPIEEVVVCSPSAADLAKARRLTARLTKTAPAEPPRAAAARTTSSSAARSVATASRRGRGRNKLDPEEVARARTRAAPYDRSRSYHEGEWFLHPSFGAGQVQIVLGPERMVTALFEDGEERRLIHARP